MAAFDKLPVAERDLWVAEWVRKRETHQECGHPFEVCSDPERVWYPFRSVCYASEAQSVARAQFDALHADRPFHDGTRQRWSDKWSREFPFRYDDGTHIDVALTDVAPFDLFTTRKNASPVDTGEPDESEAVT